MSADSPIRVKQIDHITLVSADLEKSVEFFAGLLGMEVVSRPDFPFPERWLQAGSTQIHLNEVSEEAG